MEKLTNNNNNDNKKQYKGQKKKDESGVKATLGKFYKKQKKGKEG